MSTKEQGQSNKTNAKPLAPTVLPENPEKSVTHPDAIIQQVRRDIQSFSPKDAQQLQRTIGNRAVGLLLQENLSHAGSKKTSQRISPQESLQRMLDRRSLGNPLGKLKNDTHATTEHNHHDSQKSLVQPQQIDDKHIQRLLVDLAPTEILGQKFVAKHRQYKEDQLVESNDGNQNHEYQLPKAKTKGKPGFISGLTKSSTQEGIEKSIQVDLKQVDYSKVELNEPVIFAGHGITKKADMQDTKVRTEQAQALQGYTVKNIANSLLKGLPKGYHGMIFLQGCYTASGLTINFTDGMAQELLLALKKNFPLISVKGNVGASHATESGKNDFFFRSFGQEDEKAVTIQIERYKQFHGQYFAELENLEKDLSILKQKEPQFKESGKLNETQSLLKQKKDARSELLLNNMNFAFRMQGQKEDIKETEYKEQTELLTKEVDNLEKAIMELEKAKQEFQQTPEYKKWSEMMMLAEKPILFLRKIKNEAEKGRLTFGFEEQYKQLMQ